MAKYDPLKPIVWHCPNCGNKVAGFCNADGEIRIHCGVCRVSLTRFKIARRWAIIKIEEPDEYDYC